MMKKKKMPRFRTDEEMEKFLEQDLSPYLHKGNFSKVKLEYLPKDGKINLRLPMALLSAIKRRAKNIDMPYQRYIRQVLEQEVTKD